ncbi:protein MARD1-like [Phalaenopsis equestris]|uniref:protein MARD1-like n=1 Tax=Phalaenopsis equestris TaxID=78828 RepID=UPI0009E5BCB2|nr:protein MARD1-like [Phalaenopsis equestris]XP_020591702.1 protein MARD1-like [Phalaenopsis equestris]
MTGNPSPSAKRSSPISSLFVSPKLCVSFSPKSFSDSEAIMSPTSILESKLFSAINKPFSTEKSHRKPYCGNEDSSAIGLALVDSLTKENLEKKTLNRNSRMVLFGSQLKIQIPSVKTSSCSSAVSVDQSPRTPIEFGIKNKNLQLALHSPAALQPSPPRIFTGRLSPKEMELSEDYTCVISYGPNPKKTHIFDNCVVESCEEGDDFVR